MSAMAKTSPNKASLTERIRIYELLKTIIVKADDDSDLCEYVDNWTDKAVAATAGAQMKLEVSSHTVASIRKEMFGDLRRGGRLPKADTSLLEKQLAQLEDKVARITDLEVQIDHALGKIKALDAVVAGKGQTLIDYLRRLNGHDKAITSIDEDIRALKNDLSKLKLQGKFR
jgi:hypothetical protein